MNGRRALLDDARRYDIKVVLLKANGRGSPPVMSAGRGFPEFAAVVRLDIVAGQPELFCPVLHL
jgi:hypothetical protein